MVLLAFRQLTLVNQFHQKVKKELRDSILFYRNQYTVNEVSTTSDPSLQFVFEAFGQSFIRGNDFYFILIDNNNNNNMTTEIVKQHIQEILQDINPNGNHDRIYENIDGIWSIYHSWGPCYDYINAYLATTKQIAILHHHQQYQQQSASNYLHSFPFNYICDISDYESDFSLDGGLWSTVKYVPDSITEACQNSQISESSIMTTTATTSDESEAASTIKSNLDTNTNADTAASVSVTVSDEDWEMVEIRHEMTALQLADEEENDDDTDDNNDGYNDDNKDKEQEYEEKRNKINKNKNTTITVNSTSTKTTYVNMTKVPRPGISYKDMVLRPPSVPTIPDPSSSTEMMTLEQYQQQQQQSGEGVERPKWRPKLVVTKVSEIRLDREYGPQSSTMVFDDDGNGCWDLVDAHTMLKFETAVAKRRAITMMPPKIKEKKDQRIMEKAKS